MTYNIMNLYDILGVQHNASRGEIKKAFHKLVLLHHPDKTNSQNSTQKFQEIHAAYEILIDDIKRKEYDAMTFEERAEIYDLIKQYFVDIRPEFSFVYESLKKYVYSDNEEDFRQDVNNFNIKNIFDKIKEGIRKNGLDKKNDLDTKNKKYIEVTSSEFSLTVSLNERYNNSFKYIRIPKNNNNYAEYLVPLYQQKFSINDVDKGIFNISITIDNDHNYQIINNYDLLYVKRISLSQYIYGGNIKIILPNDKTLLFEFPCCLEQKPIFMSENNGLPYINDDIEIRGNLYVYMIIEGINDTMDNEISQSYSQVLEETIKLMFPPLE